MLVVIEPPTAVVGDGPGGSITGVKRPADVMGAVGESKFLIHALYLYVCMYVCMYICMCTCESQYITRYLRSASRGPMF